MRYGEWMLAGLVALGAAACGGGDEKGGATASRRDSAGVAIVDNSGPSWTAKTGIMVVDSPLVDIGGKGGGQAYEFDNIVNVQRVGNGRIAVANSGSKEIRFYDSAGVHLKTTGRAGTGPGEYQNIAGMIRGPDDSLLVVDPVVRRMTVLDADGNTVRSFVLGGGGEGFAVPTNGKVELSIPIGWFGDGTVVGSSLSFTILQQRSGTFRDPMTLIRYTPDGAAKDSLGQYPGVEMTQMTLTFNGRSFPSPLPVPLGKQSVTQVTGSHLYVARNNAWEIEMRGPDGKLQRLVRMAAKPVPITAAEAEIHRKEQLDLMLGNPAIRGLPEAMKSQLTDRVTKAVYPPTYPWFSGLLSDVEGNLWANEVRRAGEKVARFAVIDSTGQLLGRVEMPTDFRAMFIGAGAVYGVWKDADDVEHVRVYPIRKR